MFQSYQNTHQLENTCKRFEINEITHKNNLFLFSEDQEHLFNLRIKGKNQNQMYAFINFILVFRLTDRSNNSISNTKHKKNATR